MLARIVFIASALAFFSGCSSDDYGQTHQVDGYFLRVSTDPEKLVLGRDAEFTVNIAKDDEGMADCHPRFRQYMPTRQMNTDNTWYPMEALEKGLYRSRGGNFTASGNWEVEFQFNCGDGSKKVVFHYRLAGK